MSPKCAGVYASLLISQRRNEKSAIEPISRLIAWHQTALTSNGCLCGVSFIISAPLLMSCDNQQSVCLVGLEMQVYYRWVFEPMQLTLMSLLLTKGPIIPLWSRGNVR